MKGQSSESPVFRALGGRDPSKLFDDLPTPCYVIDEGQIRRNCEKLASVMARTGCKILLAQKAFSNYALYPLISEYLTGTEASGLFEARLGREEMPDREVHVFSAAYREDEFTEILRYADHIVFNSPAQLKKFGERAKKCGKSVGIRINPQCSTQEGHAIYDPCASGSRLGTTRSVWEQEMTEDLLSLLDGIHFHTLCEQDADALAITIKAVEEKFGEFLPRMKWLNMGGGHHITRDDYDLPLLEKILVKAAQKWGVQVYLEPGEAVALNAGYLCTRVLDIVKNEEKQIAILDASAACHMPDVIEMPYTPPLYEEQNGDGEFVCTLAGPTCLSGDVIGTYELCRPLKEGDLLLFGDMAIYTTCKNNTFNGMPLPDIWKREESGKMVRLAAFGYDDFKHRLGCKR